MTEPDDKQLEDYLENKSEISRLYQESPMELPSTALDEKIMLAAREELRPRFQRWMLPLSAAAVTVFAVSIMLRMQHENISPLPQEKMAVMPEAPAPASEPAPAAVVPAMSEDNTAVAKERQTPAAVPSPKRSAVGEMKSEKRSEESPALMDAAPRPQALPSAGAAPPAPVPQDEMQEQDRARSYNAAPASAPMEREEENEGEGREVAPAQPAAKARADSTTESGGAATAGAAAQEASPETWIKRIRQLIAEGNKTGAAADIKAFRSRYPNYQLPDDLKWAD